MTLKHNSVSRRVGSKSDKAITDFIRMIKEATGIEVSYPQASDAREILRERHQAKVRTINYVITVQEVETKR